MSSERSIRWWTFQKGIADSSFSQQHDKSSKQSRTRKEISFLYCDAIPERKSKLYNELCCCMLRFRFVSLTFDYLVRFDYGARWCNIAWLKLRDLGGNPIKFNSSEPQLLVYKTWLNAPVKLHESERCRTPANLILRSFNLPNKLIIIMQVLNIYEKMYALS